MRAHWLDPSKLSGADPKAARLRRRTPPEAQARRDASGNHIVVDYTAEPDANALVVALRPKGSDEPATTKAFPITNATGEVEVPAGDRDYDVWTSIAAPDKGVSEGVKAD